MNTSDPTENPLPTKDRLIQTATRLFHARGYNGVGLKEILEEASAPKGSLYHHFPNGKSDLAIAAATKASDGMLRVIAASFGPAENFTDGATTLCHKLAKLFDLLSHWDGGCPVAATLFDAAGNAGFREQANRFYEGWIGEVQDHADRFGLSEQDARQQAEHLFILIQGAWQLARARQSSQALRDVPAFLKPS